MPIRVLRHFGQLATHCYATHLVEGQQEMIGMLLNIADDKLANRGKVAFALINMQTQTDERIVVFHSTGPANLFPIEMRLQYDLLSMRWIIGHCQDGEYIAMRTLTIVPNDEVKLSPLCLLDYDDAAETPGMQAPLALAIKDNTCSFLYSKPFDVHLTSPRIVKLDVTLQQLMWDELKDETCSVSSENVSLDLPLYPQEVLLPDNASFDLSTNNAHQTSSVHITNQTILAEAEVSMIYEDQHIHLLVLCSPEHSIKVQGVGILPPQLEKPLLPNEERQWGIWLTGWDSAWKKQHWTYSPDLRVSVSPITSTGDPPTGCEYGWPTVYMAVIAGPPIPPHSTASIVVLAAVDQEEILSHGVCLDEKGEVVQICDAPLGLRPSLCCCENMIVGVDLFEGNWRLWNWPVLQHERLNTIVQFTTICQRAFVHAEPVSGRFWLIEELQEGVRVTHRDATTLQEIASQAYLSGAVLVSSDNEVQEHPLNGYRDIGIVSYQAMLLLLAQRPQEGLVLYQIT